MCQFWDDVAFLFCLSLSFISSGVSTYIQQAIQHVDMCLVQRPLTEKLFAQRPGLHNGGLLFCGQKGIGRSSLASALCRYASGWPNLAYVAILHCKSLKGIWIKLIHRKDYTVILCLLLFYICEGKVFNINVVLLLTVFISTSY